MNRPWIAAFVALALCWVSSPAQAWTRARVISANAQVDIDRDARLHVQLELAVKVRGGWLEGLDVSGVDEHLELDPNAPARMVSAEGRVYTPEVVTSKSGRLRFRFARKKAPRRGDYRLRVAYHAPLPPSQATRVSDDQVELRWGLPGWESGLDGVTIHMSAPKGARPVPPASDNAAIEYSHTATDQGSVIVWRRAHLPRTIPWTVAIRVPADQLAIDLGPVPDSGTLGSEVDALSNGSEDEPARWPPYALVVVLCLVAALKRELFFRAARRRSVQPRPLVPVRSNRIAIPLIFACSAIAIGCWTTSLPISLVALGAVVLTAIQRTPIRSVVLRNGKWKPATRVDFEIAQRYTRRLRVRPLNWLDATMPLGLGVLLTAIALLGWFSWASAVSVADTAAVFAALTFLVPLFLNGTEHQLPARTELKLRRILHFAERLRFAPDAPAIAIRPAIYCDAEGHWQDARLRVVSARRTPGLSRIDIALVEHPVAYGLTSRPAWVVVTQTGSAAEAGLSRRLASIKSSDAPGGRRARVVPWERPWHGWVRTLVQPARVGPSVARAGNSASRPRKPRAHAAA